VVVADSVAAEADGEADEEAIEEEGAGDGAEAFEVVVSNEEVAGDSAAGVEVGGVVIVEGEVIVDEAVEAAVAAAAEGEVVPTQSSSHTDIQAYS